MAYFVTGATGFIGRYLVANLLKRDAEGRHWLVTPHEKLSIEVEDAAFLAIDVKQESGSLAFRLNTDDLIIAGPDHPMLPQLAESGYLKALFFRLDA